VLEKQGGENFFGEPALEIADLMRTDRDGRGFINVLAADKLMLARLYATFLLWLLSELFEELPEVGDPDKPKLVFFFDEAHLLFDDAPQGADREGRAGGALIRSKGVGVYFVTQNPLDVPDTVLAQLGNRVQHALRAYTPREQKAVKTAADTFRRTPLRRRGAITQLGVGEALVSTLEAKGVPSMVERTLRPSRVDPRRGLGARRQGPRPPPHVDHRGHHQERVEFPRPQRRNADRPGHHARRSGRSRPPLSPLRRDRVNCSEIRSGSSRW
jgi:uncharacterized protein